MSITVIIPTSPIPSHPSTEIIENALISVRAQLPDANIFIMMDGVRPSVEFRRAQYEEYKQKLMALSETYKFGYFVFNEPTQQAGMLRKVLPLLTDNHFMFLEHDAILDARPIDWALIEKGLEEFNLVRLYWHSTTHPEHEYLMCGRVGQFVKTIQFSGWPFVSNREWFIELIARMFEPGQQAMLETVLYGPMTANPWESYKMVIYAPDGRDYITFHHRNGRVGDDGVKDPGEW